LCFDKDGLTLLPPKSADEIIAEGHALHHCVGSYAERAANGECVILFLRKTDQPDEPFYTIELRDNQIAQARGRNSSEPTPEVQKFLDILAARALKQQMQA
jgi:hypothetical protein